MVFRIPAESWIGWFDLSWDVSCVYIYIYMYDYIDAIFTSIYTVHTPILYNTMTCSTQLYSWSHFARPQQNTYPKNPPEGSSIT